MVWLAFRRGKKEKSKFPIVLQEQKRGHSEFLHLRAKRRKASFDIIRLRVESLEESDCG